MTLLDQINELLHQITVAETREVRMALCSQIKRLLAEMHGTAGGGSSHELL